MATQASAYAVEITDAATLQAYRDGGVEYVRWISEDDGRTCPTCAERSGVIYPIDEIPAKPHINCRCRVEAVKEDAADAGESGKVEESKRVGVVETIKAGAQTGAKKTPGWEERHAERYYEEVRKRQAYSDAEKIAKHVEGFSVQEIEDIRQHVFIKEHKRNGKIARFDESYEQAEVWQRLIDGKNIKPSDTIFLKHELYELNLMQDSNYDYETVHARANELYDWWTTYCKEK